MANRNANLANRTVKLANRYEGEEIMSTINVAVLGFGTVGKGVYKTIQKHQNRFKAVLGKEVKIVAVLVKNKEKHQLPDQGVLLTNNFEDISGLSQLDVVIDAIVGREPGYSYLQAAIKRGCHVITANKEMFAYHGQQLQSLAKEHQVTVGFEATVAGGIPIIQTLNKLLNINQITKLEGILNGTSNFILTKMREERLSFTDALSLAQELGYAEADPTNDVEGFDAFYKAMILSQVVYGEQPKWDEVYRKGITDISAEKIELFSQFGLRFKHVAALEKTDKGIKCSVKPVLVSQTHPLYQIEGVQNAISIDADIVGNISIQGPGAGMFPTASAVVEDLLHLTNSHLANTYDETIEKEESSTQTHWVIIGEWVGDLPVPAPLETVGFLHAHSVIIKGQEEEVLQFVKTIPAVEFHQVYGEVLDLDLKTKELEKLSLS